MYRNGVSHLTASDDFEGVSKIIEWLAYVPDRKGQPVPVAPTADTWDRDITFVPPQKNPYDVRWLIQGKEDEEGYLSGLFDRESFQETLSGWAKTVVVGRARLGGIPVGVISVETRSVENVTPADPANPDSTEQVTQEAGQVWYPNSAFKTAQAINDFNHGEQLPLIILANWRGFSGGQRDMYNEVLKYGSYIVDALVKYEQPIIVYIPPFGELRGGSWVVVDPTINEDMMEMYADEEARGGVLEPEGIVGIKFRREKLLDTMARLDPIYGDLYRQLQDKKLSSEQQSTIKVKMVEREKVLMPVYQQVSIQFADLHDRAGRMKAKGTIRKPLQWVNARRFLYWRLRRRLNEEAIVRKMVAATNKKATRKECLKRVQGWFMEDAESDMYEEQDRIVAEWFEGNRKDINSKVEEVKKEISAVEMRELILANREGAMAGIVLALQQVPEKERAKMLELLSGAGKKN